MNAIARVRAGMSFAPGMAWENGVFQNDTFYRRPSWWCLTSGHVSVGQFAGQTGCKCKQTEETE